MIPRLQNELIQPKAAPPSPSRSSRTCWWVKTKSKTWPKETDCLAGHVGLELGNVVAKYLFERPHKFPGIQPNSGHRDYSRLSCDAGEMQLGGSREVAGQPRHPMMFYVSLHSANPTGSNFREIVPGSCRG
jgi:hypothetical protein